jgi:hypothetical protein
MWIRNDFYLGTQIQKQQQKKEKKFFIATNFTELIFFACGKENFFSKLTKNFWYRIRQYYTQKFVSKLSEKRVGDPAS